MITILRADDANCVAELISSADFLRPEEVKVVVNDFCVMGEKERWLGYLIGGRLCGLAYIVRAENSTAEWTIRFIYVRPDIRGLGIGKALKKYVEFEFKPKLWA
ncbi:GNAT family N-acetyltransferase [Vibrio sp. EA2]|uniref:GNAT family N-acetyltransferase n=1 Tax=Vibrio sp. EA2 TaxID=3079860 RepID=UPI0029491E64|nr:GNAT family N-acetyltransferase [Vibrio sp. EA2]MDV6254379.1 GNAT family N-acetyltransferase [Vibrio sp. EA2]